MSMCILLIKSFFERAWLLELSSVTDLKNYSLKHTKDIAEESPLQLAFYTTPYIFFTRANNQMAILNERHSDILSTFDGKDIHGAVLTAWRDGNTIGLVAA